MNAMFEMDSLLFYVVLKFTPDIPDIEVIENKAARHSTTPAKCGWVRVAKDMKTGVLGKKLEKRHNVNFPP